MSLACGTKLASYEAFDLTEESRPAHSSPSLIHGISTT
jgi:hypothetical protein